MKTRVRSSAKRPPTSSTPAPAPAFYTFLKPGALAQLRYSKMTARSKQIGAQTLLALSQLESISDSLFSQQHPAEFAIDGIPSFNSRVKGFPRCLQRKKLAAVTPCFSEAQT